MDNNFCNNLECDNKFWCKRFCTESHEEYKNSTNLQDKCNESNSYDLYRHWKTGKNTKKKLI